MNQDLKKLGWQRMKQMLDAEMPERRKRYSLPLWFTLTLLGIAFIAGYFFSMYRSNNYTATSYFANNTSALYKPKEKNAKSANLHIRSTHKWNYLEENQSVENSNPDITQEKEFNNSKITEYPHKNNNLILLGHKPEISPGNIFFTKPAIPSDLKKPDAFHVTDSVGQRLLTSDSLHAFSESREIIAMPDARPVAFTGFKPNIHLPIPSLTYGQKNYRHFLSFSGGSGFQKFNLFSGSIAYHFLYQKNNHALTFGAGYRYIHADFQAKQNSLKNNQNLAEDNFQSWNFSGLHQVFIDLGIHKEWNKTWFAGAGINIPYNLAQGGLFKKDQFEALETNPASGPGTNYQGPDSGHMAGIQTWDIQPYITVGKRITPETRIFSTFQASILPTNKLPLVRSGDIRLHQFSAGLQYFL